MKYRHILFEFVMIRKKQYCYDDASCTYETGGRIFYCIMMNLWWNTVVKSHPFIFLHHVESFLEHSVVKSHRGVSSMKTSVKASLQLVRSFVPVIPFLLPSKIHCNYG